MNLLFAGGLALLILTAWLRGLLDFNLRGGLTGPRSWRDFFASELGVFAITYLGNGPQYPNFNTTTAPTASQAAGMAAQTAIVSFADADSTGTVVHNWGSWYQQNVPAGFANNITSFALLTLPNINVVALNATASPSSFGTNFTFGLNNSNQITINKIGVGTGSGGSFVIYMQRSLSRG